MLMLTLVMLGQVASATYSCVKGLTSVESPIEESADEDADNELEFDKMLTSTAIENTDLLYSALHRTFLETTLSDCAFEILLPPPKV